jgi:hypothetical protein
MDSLSTGDGSRRRRQSVQRRREKEGAIEISGKVGADIIGRKRKWRTLGRKKEPRKVK